LRFAYLRFVRKAQAVESYSVESFSVKSRSVKAQVSLELLLVLAALAALLVAFVPLIQQSRGAADYAVAAKQLQLVLAQAATDCREAKLGGDGTLFVRDWFLPERASFSFDAGASELKAIFASGGETRSVSAGVGFFVVFSGASLERGRIQSVVENKGGSIEVRFQKN
jgi:hypothetical protein